MHALATTTTTLTVISTVNHGLVVYIAAETDTAEDYEIEDVLRDHERSYERKAELRHQVYLLRRPISKKLTILSAEAFFNSNNTILSSMPIFGFLNLDWLERLRARQLRPRTRN